MKRAIIITEAAETLPALIVTDDPTNPEYKQLQEFVGGWIESPPQPHPNLSIFSNEEGKLIGLAPNLLATAIFGGLLSPGDYLCGPVVVMGAVNAEGETLGLTDDQVNIFLDPTLAPDILNMLVTRRDV